MALTVEECIKSLTCNEGDWVTILGQNPEAYEAEFAVDVGGEWTRYVECRYLGDSVLNALSQAEIIKRIHEDR